MDYKNRIPGYRPPRPPKKKDRAGLWATVAVVAGLVAVAIGWAVTRPKDGPSPSQAETVTVNPAPLPVNPPKPPVKPTNGKDPVKQPMPDTSAATNPPPAKAPEPRFTFYKILPELEAIIPESEIKNLKREESLSKQPPTIQYQLQVYSYTNVQDAEKLKAKLSALKIKSHIESIKIENTTWNRVKIGPFKSLADADKVRTYLKGSQIDSVVQKAVTKPAAQAAVPKPAQTAPVKPAQPIPVKPPQPTPVKPAQPAPAKPAQTTPAKPAQPTPAKPAQAATGR